MAFMPEINAQDTTFVVPDSAYTKSEKNKPNIDTVKIQIGNKRLEIISKKQEEINKGLKNLQKGLDDFQKKIDKKKQEIEVWSDSIKILTMKMKNSPNGDVFELKIDSLKNLIEDDKDVIEALKDGIEDISESMQDLADQLKDLSENNQTVSKEYDFCNPRKNEPNEKKYKHKKFRGHWASIALGINNYVDANKNLNLWGDDEFMSNVPLKSWEFSLNLVQLSIPFFNRYVGAVTGLGITWNNYELQQNINLVVDANGNLTYQAEPDIEYKKNRFKIINLTVPLLIEIQIPVNRKDQRFYVAAGFIGSLNLDSKMKYVYYQHNRLMKIKDKASLFPINLYNYQLSARMGYKDTYFYVNYSVLSLFKTSKGPALYPVSAGIGISF